MGTKHTFVEQDIEDAERLFRLVCDSIRRGDSDKDIFLRFADMYYVEGTGAAMDADKVPNGPSFLDRACWAETIAVRWAACAYPTVQISSRFAAAAMVTAVEGVPYRDIRSPWRAFKIVVPEDLLFAGIVSTGTRRALTSIYVMGPENDESPWFLMARGGPLSGEGSTRIIMPSEKNLQNLATTEYQYDGPVNTSDDTRCNIGRIVFSTMCALTNANNIEIVDKGVHARHASARRLVPEPVARVFKITTPVTIDLTAAVRAAQLGGTGKPVTVQSLVCGHWKHQPHGPRNTLRKWQWLQPYWRGPEAAAIALRPHVIHEART